MIEAMKTPESRELTIRGLRHHFTCWGDAGAPLLLMLHGWGDAGGSFQFESRTHWRVVRSGPGGIPK